MSKPFKPGAGYVEVSLRSNNNFIDTLTQIPMNADCKGALAQINKSYKAFVHNGKPMTKPEVKAVLEYAVKKGYEHTGLLSEEEIDSCIAAVNGKIQTNNN